jgi:putative serine protease PepD
VTTAPKWGWRALVAFVAGGALAASGFAIGTFDRSSTPILESSPATTVVTTTNTPAPSTAPPSTLPLPEDGEVEAAQLVSEMLGPSVVQITTTTGIGSGVIYGDGLILTNNHVIAGASDIIIQLNDGRHFSATVVGSDPNVDIAVISVGEGLGLPVAALATGEKPSVGQTAIAIGSPFSLQQTVTEGIVSAVDRPVPNGEYYTAMIQTDAPINPGNSGGALADRFGRVIGINTAIQTGGVSNSNAGVGFAVPIDTAISVAERILAGEPIEPGFLGVRGAPSSDGSAGVEVTDVTAGSAAEVAGIRVGDRILSIDGAPVSQFEELAGLVVARQPGDKVVLDVVRNGQTMSVEAVLGQRE